MKLGNTLLWRIKTPKHAVIGNPLKTPPFLGELSFFFLINFPTVGSGYLRQMSK
jgi:hypothetical protein